jgi:hypothetical protein
MTYAERAAANRERDDKHMIYEMMNISQYEDGSVLECITMTTYTAQEAAAGVRGVRFDGTPATLKLFVKDLQRNAKSALKQGKTENLAPRV